MKKITALLIALILVIGLTACGSFVCDMCSEEKSGKKHTEEILGEEIVICDDCYEKLEEVGNMLK